MFTFASLYYLLKEKHTLAFSLLSIGFCFKLQMIFVLPLFIIAYACFHRFTLLQFFQIPAWYIIWGIPAIAFGRRWQDVYKTYLMQMGQENAMTINTPGFYLLGLNDYYGLYRAAIIFVFVYVLMFRRKLIRTSAVMIICSICTYSNALLYSSPIPLWLCSIAYFVAYIAYGYDYLKEIRNVRS